MKKNQMIIRATSILAASLLTFTGFLVSDNHFIPHKTSQQMVKTNHKSQQKRVKILTSSTSSFLDGKTQTPVSIPANEKVAYLTFDDGPSINTPKILDILKANNVKASFFVIGNETPFGTSMYKRIVAEGHTIGNHTFSHRYDLIYRSVPQFLSDFNRDEELIYQATGIKAVMVRLPGGSNNTVSFQYGGRDLMPKIATELTKEKYTFTDWNVDSSDAERAVQPVSAIVNRVLNTTYGQKSIIVLMHDAPEKVTTVEALSAIIQGLKKQGYHFYPLSPNSQAVQFIHY